MKEKWESNEGKYFKRREYKRKLGGEGGIIEKKILRTFTIFVKYN